MNDKLLEQFARAGYLARGVVYVLIGGLATLSAMGRNARAPDSHGALKTVLAQPFGSALLAALAVGLLVFSAWRAAQALLDSDHLGHSIKGILRRLGYGVGALVNLGLAVSAVSLAFPYSERHGGDEAARDWTASLMEMPFGRVLVALIGLGIIGGGIGAAFKGLKGTFTEKLRLGPDAQSWIVPLGRLGFCARAIVFLIVGGFLMVAALHTNASEAKGVAGALAALEAQAYGRLLLLGTAVGLFAFGVFQLASARYRVIDSKAVTQAGMRLKQKSRAAMS